MGGEGVVMGSVMKAEGHRSLERELLSEVLYSGPPGSKTPVIIGIQ